MASAPLEGGETAAMLRRDDVRAQGDRFAVSPWCAFDSPAAIAEWDELASSASEPNPFCESWNLLPALRGFARSGAVDLATLHIAGELCGLMPLARSASYYGYPIPHLGNWSHANLFVGNPLVRRGCEERFWGELFAWADRHPGGALFLHLDRLAEDGPLFAALARTAGAEGREWGLVHREERAFLRSDLDPEAYFEASLTGKKRKELRRQHKRLSEAGALRFERQTGAQDLDAWVGEFLALEQAGWKGRNRSALVDDPATRAWFAHAMHGAAAHGRLECLRLSLDGAAIAMLANFIAPPGAFSFKTAFDERFARFSPGVLLQRENLELLARDDVDWCDSCAAADHPMIERIWREKRAMVRVNVAIGGPLRRSLFRQVLRAELRKQAKGS